jgi:RNA polymerase sigma-70 factor (ECF subfamily)
VIAGPGNPELSLAVRRDVEEFKDAFAEAVTAIPDKERAILRLHFVDGLTIDEIGVVYRVHRATAARWLGRARTTLLGEIRRRLAARLGATDSELDSVMRGVRSQLDISLCNFLVTRP